MTTYLNEKAGYEYGYGWKFLSRRGSTIWRQPGTCLGRETFYKLPREPYTWGPWMKHPDPYPITLENPCGSGRYHIMKRLDARYAPAVWWPWFAEYRYPLGEDYEKLGARWIRLMMVTRQQLIDLANVGQMQGSCLERLDLRGIMETWKQPMTFTDSTLKNSNLNESTLGAVVVSGGDWSNLSINDVKWNGVRFDHVSMKEWMSNNAYIKWMKAWKCDMSHQRHYSGKMDNLHIQHCNMRGLHFVGTKATSSHIEFCDLRESRFHGCNLRSTYFLGCDMSDALFERCDLRGCDFSQIKSPGLKFIECQLDNATMYRITLKSLVKRGQISKEQAKRIRFPDPHKWS